jgi:hypothetical protein
MEHFFTWIAELTRRELLAFATIIALGMLMVPYASFLLKAVHKIILWKRMKVIHFGYAITRNDDHLATSKHGDNQPDSDFILEGSAIFLQWKVEGAIQVRLLPGIGKVNGNAAKVLVTRTRRKFALEVRGLFRKQTVQLEIPLGKIKTLCVSEISELEVVTNHAGVQTFPYSESKLHTKAHVKQLPNSALFKQKPLQATRRLIQSYPQSENRLLKILNDFSTRKSLTKTYTFSTRKYQTYHSSLTNNK